MSSKVLVFISFSLLSSNAIAAIVCSTFSDLYTGRRNEYIRNPKDHFGNTDYSKNVIVTQDDDKETDKKLEDHLNSACDTSKPFSVLQIGGNGTNVIERSLGKFEYGETSYRSKGFKVCCERK